MKAIEWIKEWAVLPISPRNLRIAAILIAVYQVLIAHIVLFVMLLGLAHAEQMKTLLGIDIADSKERDEYYEVITNSKGETLNEVRFKSASELASVTLLLLYVGTGIATVYLFSCLGLFVGVFKHRPELILPWLVLDMIGVILILAIMVIKSNSIFTWYAGGHTQYWLFCIGFAFFDIAIWIIIHGYYLSLRQMRKLTEIATVAIPCPAPGSIPFHFRKENMYLGSGGYKHILTDNDPNPGA